MLLQLSQFWWAHFLYHGEKSINQKRTSSFSRNDAHHPPASGPQVQTSSLREPEGQAPFISQMLPGDRAVPFLSTTDGFLSTVLCFVQMYR